jgi:hypothetical protein
MGVSSKFAQPELITAHPIRDGSFLRNSSVIGASSTRSITLIGTAPHKASIRARLCPMPIDAASIVVRQHEARATYGDPQ